MRILIVSPYFPPQRAIASLRAHSFASTWSAAGAEVTVLTTQKRSDQAGWPMPREGFRVHEVPFRAPRMLEVSRRAAKRDEAAAETPEPAPGAADGGGGVSAGLVRRLRQMRDDRGIFASVRMPDLTHYWVRPAAAWALAQPPWDVVFSSAGPYTAHLVGLAIRTGGGAARWAAEFRDLWVDNHVHRGLFPFTVRERALERRCLARTDLVVTVSEGLAGFLRPKTRSEVMVVYNGFDPAEVETLPPDPIFTGDGLVRLVFTGSLYPTGQDPAPLLRAFARLRERDPDAAGRLRLVVVGASTAHWRARAERCGAAELLDARGTVPRADARRLQRDADALVLVDFEANVAGALTSKAFEYLAARAPVLLIGGAAETPLRSLVADSRRGVALGHDEEAIARVLADLAGGRPIIEETPDVEMIGSFTRARQAERLLARLERLVAGGSACG
jgi:hypothetical protein